MSFLATIKSWFGFGSTPGALKPGDRSLTCADCGDAFVFDAGEQKFFRERGFTDPKRCPNCRKSARGHFVEHGPEREQIASYIDALGSDLFGRHIRQRAAQGLGAHASSPSTSRCSPSAAVSSRPPSTTNELPVT